MICVQEHGSPVNVALGRAADWWVAFLRKALHPLSPSPSSSSLCVTGQPGAGMVHVGRVCVRVPAFVCVYARVAAGTAAAAHGARWFVLIAVRE